MKLGELRDGVQRAVFCPSWRHRRVVDVGELHVTRERGVLGLLSAPCAQTWRDTQARALRAEVRLLIAGAGRLVAEPLTVAAVGECADLVAGEADEVALADEPFVALCRGLRYAE
jgi:hypothetical protein